MKKKHIQGQHDFGDPIAPYLESTLVFKREIPNSERIVDRDYKDRAISPVRIRSVQFFSRDNGTGGVPDRRDTTYAGGSCNIIFANLYEPVEMSENPIPPALILHGGSGNADTNDEQAIPLASKGYAVMCIDIPALYGELPKIEGEELPRSISCNADETKRFCVAEEEGGAANSTIVNALVTCIQGANTLCTNQSLYRHTIDHDKLGVFGSSWGGFSTTFVASVLGDKVKAAFAQYGSGFYGLGSYWTANGFYPKERFAREEWDMYLDCGYRVQNMTAHYFMDSATRDDFFWPRMIEKTLSSANNTKSRNHVKSYTGSHHSISESESLYHFFDFVLKQKGEPFPTLSLTGIKLDKNGDNLVYFHASSNLPIESIQLIFADCNGDWRESRIRGGFEVEPAIIDVDKIENTTQDYIARIPAETAKKGVEFYGLLKEQERPVYVSSQMGTSIFTL